MKDYSRRQSLLLTAEMRALSPIEKAIMLVTKHHASLREAAFLCDIKSFSTIRDAMVAQKQGRLVGKNGRPKNFNDQQEVEIIQKLKNRSETEQFLIVIWQERFVTPSLNIDFLLMTHFFMINR